MAESQESVINTRRLTLHMVVLSQVHIAYQQYLSSKKQFDRADSLNQIEKSILSHITNQQQSEAESNMELIRSKVSALMVQIQRDQSWAQFQESLARNHVTLGLEPLPATIQSHKVDQLADTLETVMQNWNRGDFALSQIK
jgi:outer membrane protein, multidrug efflux system